MMEIRAFKNELRNYKYYLSRVITLTNSIDYLYDRLGGVRGIDPSKEPTHSQPNKELEYKLRDDISRLESKKSLVEDKIKDIDETLNKMEEPLKTCVISMYIDGTHLIKLADELYLSPSGLMKRMNREIKRALDI